MQSTTLKEQIKKRIDEADPRVVSSAELANQILSDFDEYLGEQKVPENFGKIFETSIELSEDTKQHIEAILIQNLGVFSQMFQSLGATLALKIQDQIRNR